MTTNNLDTSKHTIATVVLDSSGNTLTPTHPARARQLLRNHKAEIVTLDPFTIQLSKPHRSNLMLKSQDTSAIPITNEQAAEMPTAQVDVRPVGRRVVIADQVEAGVDFAQESSDKTVLTYYKYEDVYLPPQAPIVEERKSYVYTGFDRSSGDKRDYNNSIKGSWFSEGLTKDANEVSPTAKKSVYDRHRLVCSQNVEVLYPKDQPNPVYVVTTIFRGMQYEAVLTTTLMLGFFEDGTYYQNGAWQGSRSESWYGHHEAVITKTIPSLTKVEDENDEHYGMYYEKPQVTVRETTWGIMWYHSPTDAMAEIMEFNPSYWLEDFHVV